MINAALTPNPDTKAHAHRFVGKEEYAQKMRYKHAKFSVILNLCLIAGALLFIRCALAMNGYFNTLDMSKDAEISAIKPMQAPRVNPPPCPPRAYCTQSLRNSVSTFFTLHSQLLTSTEWLRGDRLCTWKGAMQITDRACYPSHPCVCAGNHHLAWSVPMSDPSYNIMGAGIHR